MQRYIATCFFVLAVAAACKSKRVTEADVIAAKRPQLDALTGKLTALAKVSATWTKDTVMTAEADRGKTVVDRTPSCTPALASGAGMTPANTAAMLHHVVVGGSPTDWQQDLAYLGVLEDTYKALANPSQMSAVDEFRAMLDAALALRFAVLIRANPETDPGIFWLTLGDISTGEVLCWCFAQRSGSIATGRTIVTTTTVTNLTTGAQSSSSRESAERTDENHRAHVSEALTKCLGMPLPPHPDRR